MNPFYAEALKEAHLSYSLHEVPVGCVIVKNGVIIGRGHNTMEKDHDPSCHAEIHAIREASDHLKNWRLTGCILYVTLEPCLMCAAAIKKSKIRQVVIGTIEPREGAFGSVLSINDLPPYYHHVDCMILYDDASEMLLKKFFKELRHDSALQQKND